MIAAGGGRPRPDRRPRVPARGHRHRPGPAGPAAAAVAGQPPADRLRPLPGGLGHRPGALLRTGHPAAGIRCGHEPLGRGPAGSTAQLDEVDAPVPAGPVRRRDARRWPAVAELDEQLGHVGPRQRHGHPPPARSPGQPSRTRPCAAAPTRCWCWTSRCPTTTRYLPAFIESGQTVPGRRELRAPSAAPASNRAACRRFASGCTPTGPSWPGRPTNSTRRLFEDLFRLLADFGRYHPEFYGPIREELVTWILHERTRSWPRAAARRVRASGRLVRGSAAGRRLRRPGSRRPGRASIVFQEGLSDRGGRPPARGAGRHDVPAATRCCWPSRARISGWATSDRAASGSRASSRATRIRATASASTPGGQALRPAGDHPPGLRPGLVHARRSSGTSRCAAIPFGTPMLPTFGCCRPELGALSMAYVSDLTVWEKIREFSSVRGPGTTPPVAHALAPADGPRHDRGGPRLAQQRAAHHPRPDHAQQHRGAGTRLPAGRRAEQPVRLAALRRTAVA